METTRECVWWLVRKRGDETKREELWHLIGGGSLHEVQCGGRRAVTGWNKRLGWKKRCASRQNQHVTPAYDWRLTNSS
jgi:hypothetical protein